MTQRNAKCSYEIEREIKTTLLLKCRGCGGASALNDRHCLKGVLEIFAEEPSVNNVVLSNFTEKQYHSDAVELLKSMATIVNEMEYLAIRDPSAEFGRYAGSEKQPKPNCGKCGQHPSRLFGELKGLLVEDVDGLYREISRISDAINKDKDGAVSTVCKKCMATTADDIVHLNSMLSKLESFVAYKGFSVIV